MAYTGPTDDIIVQEGTFAYSFTCSGSITKGQAVYPINTMEVKKSAVASNLPLINCVGVAAYTQTDDNKIAVYGPGNIVRVIVSGTSTAVGDRLIPTSEGKWMEIAGYHNSGCMAIALEAQATNAGTCRVLLI